MISHKSNADIYYDLLLRLKKVFARGGHTRQKYTYPTLIFSMIRLTAFMNSPPAAAYAEEEEEKKEPAAGEEDEEPEPLPTV